MKSMNSRNPWNLWSQEIHEIHELHHLYVWNPWNQSTSWFTWNPWSSRNSKLNQNFMKCPWNLWNSKKLWVNMLMANGKMLSMKNTTVSNVIRYSNCLHDINYIRMQKYLPALIEKKKSSRVSGLCQNYLNLLETCIFVKYP